MGFSHFVNWNQLSLNLGILVDLKSALGCIYSGHTPLLHLLACPLVFCIICSVSCRLLSACNIPVLGKGHADTDDIVPAGLSSSQADGKTAILIMANVRYCHGWDLGWHGFSWCLSDSCQGRLKESGEGLWCEGEFQAGVCDLALPLRSQFTSLSLSFHLLLRAN